MNLCQLAPKKGAAIFILPCLVLACLFTGCASSGGPVSHTTGRGQVLIRLVEAPGNIFPSLRAVPLWELYGDGTLLYQPQAAAASPATPLQAQLQPAEVAHLLDVVVNQNAFFADHKSLYGQMMADVGELVLTVNTNRQQKTVSLFGEEGAPATDQHMFAILHFLQSYRPAGSHPYAAPGAIVLVRPYSAGPLAPPWPYPDIGLQQIAAQECKTFYNGSQGPCAASDGPGGYFPLYGARGTTLLHMFKNQQSLLMSQDGQTYILLAWPLLPDNLIAQADGKRWVETFGMNGGRWPLLAGAH